MNLGEEGSNVRRELTRSAPDTYLALSHNVNNYFMFQAEELYKKRQRSLHPDITT
jgi:hypothetical protein